MCPRLGLGRRSWTLARPRHRDPSHTLSAAGRIRQTRAHYASSSTRRESCCLFYDPTGLPVQGPLPRQQARTHSSDGRRRYATTVLRLTCSPVAPSSVPGQRKPGQTLTSAMTRNDHRVGDTPSAPGPVVWRTLDLAWVKRGASCPNRSGREALVRIVRHHRHATHRAVLAVHPFRRAASVSARRRL